MADLPIAAIVCISLGLYVAVIIGIVLLCYCLKGRGRCSGESTCCAKNEGEPSCTCCMSLSEACDCCKSPSLRSCLDSCCPKKRITCVDLIMCQCCSSDGTTFCDLKCCGRCRRKGGDPETCNCLCLEIRLRSSKDLKLPPPPSSSTAAMATSSKVKSAWMSDPNPYFHGIPILRDSGSPRGYRMVDYDSNANLQLDLGWFRGGSSNNYHTAAFPVSTHPFNTSRSDHSGDLVPTSTPRFHQGRSQLFIRPGVHSAGRVIAKQQSGNWGDGGGGGGGRRLSMRRRSSRRVRSPLMIQQQQGQQQQQLQQQQQQRSSLQRRRSSRVTTGVSSRHTSRRQSHRESAAPSLPPPPQLTLSPSTPPSDDWTQQMPDVQHL